MLSLRRIDAPGIEINEIDHSQYNNKPDYSLPNAPTCLLAGFSDQGENESTTWINSKQTLIDTYGYPTNEPERYFYNGCLEVLARGGLLIGHKLPYDNYSKDRYAYVKYVTDGNVNVISTCNQYKEINVIDSDLTSYITLLTDDSGSVGSTVNVEEFDAMMTHSSTKLTTNSLYIFDITKQQYRTTAFNSALTKKKDLSDDEYVNTNDCLGTIPVIVTPANAMFFLNMISSDGNEKTLMSLYNPVASYTTITPETASGYEMTIDVDQLNNPDNLYVPLSAETKNDISMSRTASLQFPNIASKSINHLDTYYMKQIGVVVFRAYTDVSNNDKISFDIVESFVGSLDRNAKNNHHASIFIDDVINNNSKYIRFFSNISKQSLEQASFVAIQNQVAASLGFFKCYCEKYIHPAESIAKPLDRLFEKLNNPMAMNIDLVVDAGVTNTYTYLSGLNATYDDAKLNEDTVKPWTSIALKFDVFCKSTRKDCMFIADAPRPLCLDGNLKLIRKTNRSSTIDKDIIPKFKLLTGVNSSYSAGYSDWFLTTDDYSGDLFWCPPSIKAASTYCYTDTYFHSWNAPAGLTRGVVRDVIDLAFNPSNSEAGKIYTLCWNYAVNYPLDGIVFEGQKTFQKAPTALDRINVRRLLLWLEKQVFLKAKYFLYENNTQYLRSKFVDTIRPFFEQAKNSDGLIDYVIKCDNDNNTPTTIDRNELHCTIAVKPVKSLEFLILNFICTNQSANVTEEATNF